MSSSIVFKSETVIDNVWPTYLIRENCLSNRTEITREILIQITDWTDLDKSSRSFVRQMTQLVTLVANNSQLRQLRENFEQNYSLQSQLSNSQFRYGSFVVISLSFTTIFCRFITFFLLVILFQWIKLGRCSENSHKKVSTLTISYLLIEC